MNTVLPIAVVLALGTGSAVLFSRLSVPFPVRGLLAALLATLLWCAGVHIFLQIVAPGEAGRLLPGPIMMIFATTLAAAFVVGGFIRARDRRRRPGNGSAAGA